MRFLRWGGWVLAVGCGLAVAMAWETVVMKSDLAFYRKAVACLQQDPAGATAADVLAEWYAKSKTATKDPRYYAVAAAVAERQNRPKLVEFNRNMTVETVLAGGR